MVCRTGQNFMGRWGSPAMYALEGASFRISARRPGHRFRAAHHERSWWEQPSPQQSKTGSRMLRAAAGPVGRAAAAESDAYMRAEILTYSRSRGLFAGVSLEGSTLRPDDDANEALYGRKISATAILLGPGSPRTPLAAGHLIAALAKASPAPAPLGGAKAEVIDKQRRPENCFSGPSYFGDRLLALDRDEVVTACPSETESITRGALSQTLRSGSTPTPCCGAKLAGCRKARRSELPSRSVRASEYSLMGQKKCASRVRR